ncbi:hypothetical protein L596_013263 [Steinernema carpocapsae]|uniref:Tyrosine-protein phosphatase domain-containing protein n=1 Tax=Steinernema carpocapsae TaxID=34508 RepID=A0A4U5P0H1_STECR|nr:hypothetical protein L596_013263 [Steinernema carpocapsae]
MSAGPAVAFVAPNGANEVEKWAMRALNKGIKGLQEEFLELKRYVPANMAVGTFTANWDAGRNRYKDVPCQDKFRVVLKWPGSPTDYIHANYVATPISEEALHLHPGPSRLHHC